MKITVKGKATAKLRNNWWPASMFNKTTSRDLNETFEVDSNNWQVQKDILSDPFPVFVVASFKDGIADVKLRVLGFTVASYNHTVLSTGDTLPFKFSWNGQSVEGTITFSS